MFVAAPRRFPRLSVLQTVKREPAAAGGRASVSEGSDAAGSVYGVRLPVVAPYGSNEGVRMWEGSTQTPFPVAAAVARIPIPPFSH